MGLGTFSCLCFVSLLALFVCLLFEWAFVPQNHKVSKRFVFVTHLRLGFYLLPRAADVANEPRVAFVSEKKEPASAPLSGVSCLDVSVFTCLVAHISLFMRVRRS